MTRIYTRAGDSGYTWAPIAGRVRKSHECVEALGDLDEAESLVALAAGIARARGDERTTQLLLRVERMLFSVGFTLWGRECVSNEDVALVERLIDELIGGEELRGFTLHPPDELVASIAAARAAVRRAERSIWRCLDRLRVEPRGALAEALRLLNRLSDLLYALEYSLAKRMGMLETVSCRG